MTIDWTLDAGTILTILAFVGGGLGFFIRVRTDLTLMRVEFKTTTTRLIAVEATLGKLSDVLVATATQGSRLDDHSNRLSRLERDADGRP